MLALSAMKQVDLVINPADDPAFRDDVAEAVEKGAKNPRELTDGLRRAYPLISVHERSLVGETRTVWYVYREGRWVRPTREDGRNV
jgi:hypothetical protein